MNAENNAGLRVLSACLLFSGRATNCREADEITVTLIGMPWPVP